MSSKRAIRRRAQRKGCAGKQPHATEQAALFHSRELYQSGRTKPGTLNVYRCGFCRRYHVGHRRGAPPAVLERRAS